MDISIHALRGEGDAGRRNPRPSRIRDFNPRPPWGGRLFVSNRQKIRSFISIHALRGEGDNHGQTSRHSAQISIHALRGEGDHQNQQRENPNRISIHALRGEGDVTAKSCQARALYFNPRPPWGGRRTCSTVSKTANEFQSTPSVGRATLDPSPTIKL